MHVPELRGARVGVVIPAYRVEPQIQKVLRGIPDWVERVFVVDDRSPDAVSARVEELGDPRVTLIRHELNQGVGGAMRTGFRAALDAGMDVIVKMDGDDQMDPVYLPQLVQPLVDGQADFTKGNRYSSAPSLSQMPFVRVIGNAGLTFLVKLASGYWNIFDPANGYVAVRATQLRRIELARLPSRYFFESGLLIELGKLRAVIKDVPIAARYQDEHSSLSITNTLLTFPPQLVWGLGRRLFWRYFVHDFAALSVFVMLGVPLLCWGVVYGLLVWRDVLTSGVDATAGQVMLAAMPVLLGVQFLTQAVVLDIQSVPREPLSGPFPIDEPVPTARRREPSAGASS
jgi:glycosyltransferase involved in cell wall biosynthesis